MYEKALALITDVFGDYYPQYDQSFNTNIAHLMAGRMRDTAYILSNYPGTGGVSAERFANILEATYTDRPGDCYKIGHELVTWLIEFLQTNSPRDL